MSKITPNFIRFFCYRSKTLLNLKKRVKPLKISKKSLITFPNRSVNFSVMEKNNIVLTISKLTYLL